jgi:hypothetical protein
MIFSCSLPTPPQKRSLQMSSNFRVMDVEGEFNDLVSIEVDRSSVHNTLAIAIDNAKEKIELLHDSILEMGGGHVSWLDGRDGAGLDDELDALLQELRTQIIAKAGLVTIYNAL